jgi:predicted enzyme related to lactoylglutathione lyase
MTGASTEEQMPDHATFYWNELVTHDVEGAKKFYKAVLGWTVEEMPMPSGQKYNVVKVNGKPACGIMARTASAEKDEDEGEGGEEGEEGEEGESQWMAYVHVNDVDAVVAKVDAAGGEVIQPCFDVPGVGRIAVVADSTGAVIGIMTAKPG